MCIICAAYARRKCVTHLLKKESRADNKDLIQGEHGRPIPCMDAVARATLAMRRAQKATGASDGPVSDTVCDSDLSSNMKVVEWAGKHVVKHPWISTFQILDLAT